MTLGASITSCPNGSIDCVGTLVCASPFCGQPKPIVTAAIASHGARRQAGIQAGIQADIKVSLRRSFLETQRMQSGPKYNTRHGARRARNACIAHGAAWRDRMAADRMAANRTAADCMAADRMAA